MGGGELSMLEDIADAYDTSGRNRFVPAPRGSA